MLLHCRCVAHPHLCGVALHKACSTHDLKRIYRRRLSNFECLMLGGLSVAYERLTFNAFIPVGRRVPEEEAGRIELHGGFSNHEGDALIGDDRTSKGDALFGVVAGIFERSAGCSTGDTGTQDGIEACRADYAAIARFAKHGTGRDHGIVEGIRSAWSRDQAEVFGVRIDLQASQLIGDYKGAETCKIFGTFDAQQDDAWIGTCTMDDVALAAVQDIAVTVAAGSCTDIGERVATAMFGKGEATT